MNRIYLLSGAAWLAWASGHTVAGAQTTVANDSALNRTVVVENLYNPDIMSAQKITLLPTLEEPQAAKKHIEYATDESPTAAFVFRPMEAFAPAPAQGDAYRGYLRAGYGTGGNVDALFGYRFDWGKRDRLEAALSFEGMKGSIELPDVPASDYEWDARAYRTKANVDWTHRFNTLTFGVKAHGETQTYNLLDYLTDQGHQTNSFAGLQFTLGSHKRDADIRFTAGTGVLYARQKYASALSLGDNGESESLSEIRIKSHALVTGDIGGHSDVNLAVEMDNLFYDTPLEEMGDSYTSLTLNPYYNMRGDKWQVRVGAHIDPLFGDFGDDFAFAPDLYGGYSFSQSYTLYVQATGGRTLNDLRAFTGQLPYQRLLGVDNANEVAGIPADSYTKMDARVGFRATPLNELQLHLYAGYRMTDNLLVGCYAAEGLTSGFWGQEDAKTLYAGGAVQYAWKDLLTTRAEVEWGCWDADVADLYATLLPELSFKWTADVQPLSGLHVNLSYLYEMRVESEMYARPDAAHNLGATVSYRILPWLTAYAHGDNLLNQKYYRHVIAPAQGIHFMAGASVEF